MTDEMMCLRALLEKSSVAELLREMMGFAARRLMELGFESLTGAAHGARDPYSIRRLPDRPVFNGPSDEVPLLRCQLNLHDLTPPSAGGRHR